MRRVFVVPHDTRWSVKFAAESARIAKALGGSLFAIHHIGSTAIPGIDAKRVIDMLAEAASLAEVDSRAGALAMLGYVAMGEYGVAGRRYFRKDDDPGEREFHLHVFAADSPNVERHLAFRDFMRAHPQLAREYSDVKRALAWRRSLRSDADEAPAIEAGAPGNSQAMSP